MSDGKVRRVDYYPDEMVAGVAGQLSAADFGIYWMVCTLIYSRGGPIDDDHTWLARLFHGTHWRAVRASLDRLIEAGKIRQEGGKLMVTRCADELQKAGMRIASATQNGRKGGRPSRKNNDLDKPDGSGSEKLTTNHQPPTTNHKDDDEDSARVRESEPLRETIATTSEADAIVEGFDQSLFDHFEIRRLSAQPFDAIHAQRWLDAGATPEFCIQQIRRVHAKLSNSRYDPPRQLGYHSADISRAIGEAHKPLETYDDAQHHSQHRDDQRGQRTRRGRGSAGGFIAALDRAADCEPGGRGMGAAAGS